MADEAADENAPILRLDLIGSVSFGDKRIIFEQTKLEDVQMRFGGTMHDHDSASGKVIWLCFVRPVTATGKPETIGFVLATALAADHAVTLVAVQQVDAGKTDDCAAEPMGVNSIAFGVPALGAADLKAHFGQVPYDALRNVYYNSVRPTGDASGKSIYRRLGYAVTRRGIVVGVSVSQITN
jgi:hypothetical protein